MPRLYIKVIEQKHKLYGRVHKFTVRAEITVDRQVHGQSGRVETGKAYSFLFEEMVHEDKMSEEALERVNEGFKLKLIYLKHCNGYPDKEHEKELDMRSHLDASWSSTKTGIGIRPLDDPMPEWKPFVINK